MSWAAWTRALASAGARSALCNHAGEPAQPGFEPRSE